MLSFRRPSRSAVKILISAYACEPGRGSEPGVGWNLVRELSARHELWVLTRANHEAAIRASGEPWTTRVHWVFIDPPRALTFWKKGGRGLVLFYFLWQRCAFREACRLRAEHAFDVVHHLTFGNFLPPSPLAELGLPFVAGPLGGGEEMPPDLFEGCDLRTKWVEWSRGALRDLARYWPAVRRCYGSAAACLAATPATAGRLQSFGARRVTIQFQSGLDEAELRHLAGIGGERSGSSGPLRLVAASRLIAWKGIDLAIEAVALARSRGIDVELVILQDGPERGRLEALCRKCGVEGAVTFAGRLPTRDDVFREIAAADALIHPAWHEAFGQVCLESLALGVPVICLDWAGPGGIVDENCGYKVSPGPRDQVVEGFAAAMGRAMEDRPPIKRMAVAARTRAGLFRWSAIAGAICNEYLTAQTVPCDRLPAD